MIKKIFIGIALLTILFTSIGCIPQGIDKTLSKGDDYESLVTIAKQVTLPQLSYSTINGKQFTWSDFTIRFRGYDANTGDKLYTITIYELPPESDWTRLWNNTVTSKFDLMIARPNSMGQNEFSIYVYTLSQIESNVLGHNAEWMLVP